MYSVSMNITPHIAEEFLKKNIENNRPLNGNRVAMLAKALQNGEFYPNGNTIKFDTAGRLIDGQHRLSACVRADVPFESIVVYDVDEKAFSVIDREQQNRTQSQAHNICGHDELLSNSNVLASINLINRYITGNIKSSVETQCELFNRYEEAIKFVYRIGAFFPAKINGIKGFRIPAVVNAFLILAYDRGYDKDDINKFASTYRLAETYEGYANKIVLQYRTMLVGKVLPRSTGGKDREIVESLKNVERLFVSYINNSSRIIKAVKKSIID